MRRTPSRVGRVDPSRPTISFSRAPSKTGEATRVPGSAWRASSGMQLGPLGARPRSPSPRLAAQPRCSSRICPTFIRPGTPSGLRTTSTGVPSSRNGMSSTGQDLGDDALVAVPAGELVAVGDLALVRDVDPDELVDARRQLVALVLVEHLDADDGPGLAVRHLQGGVADLAGLLAEDGAQQPLLRGQLGLALGRDLADEEVAVADLGADPDDPALVEVGEDLLGDVGDVAGDLLRAELGVAGVDLVLLDVDRGEDVVLDEPLAEDDRVLVVVALPGHERHEEVAPERHLATVGGGTVGDEATGLDAGRPRTTMTRWLYELPWLDRLNLLIR